MGGIEDKQPILGPIEGLGSSAGKLPQTPAPPPPADSSKEAPAIASISSVKLSASGLRHSDQPAQTVQFSNPPGHAQTASSVPTREPDTEAMVQRLFALLEQKSSETMDQAILNVVREAKGAGRLNDLLDRLRETPHEDSNKLRLLFRQFDAHSTGAYQNRPGMLRQMWDDTLVQLGLRTPPPSPSSQADIVDLLDRVFSDKSVSEANLRELCRVGKQLAWMVVADVKPADLSPPAKKVLLEVLEADDGWKYRARLQGIHDQAIEALRKSQ